MGYYTSYRFDVVDGDAEKFFNELHGLYGFRGKVGASIEEMKWYEHDEHIVKAMRASEVTSVEIHGEGEEQGDVWDKAYQVFEDGDIVMEKTKYVLQPEKGPSETKVFK